MTESKKQRKKVDWEGVEREYRTGTRSLRDIGAEFGCTEGAIRKKAKAEGWERDLSAGDRETVKRVAGPRLVELGYATGDDW